MADIQTIFDWLVEGAPGALSPPDVIARLGPDLVEAGVPIDRVKAFVRTLHPHIVGRSFLWEPGRAVEVRENSYAYLQSPTFLNSPAAAVFRSGQALRRQLTDPACPRDFALLDELSAEGFTDYLAEPITFMSGQVHAITFATRRTSGFSEAHVAMLRRILQPLSRVAEIFALSRTAVNLLNTYVGRNAGERIMAGNIQRGDTDTIHAVIWCSDLRDFTALASAMEPGALIHVLNDLFECQVSAIERNRGEVLKFMGDGLLAIFPIDAADRAPSALCDAALAAAAEAFAALSDLNEARSERGETSIRFGLALHLGDVAYGNVGGAGRLDFTCIGPAVNFAARLEGLTARLDRKVVLSEAFARLTTRPLTAAGTFELKGVAEPQQVFVPDGF